MTAVVSIDWASITLNSTSNDFGIRLNVGVYLTEPPAGHYFIMDDRVTLTLNREDNDRKILELSMYYKRKYLTISSVPYHVVFTTQINHDIIKTVEKERNGQDIKVMLRIESVMAEVDRSTKQFKEVMYLYLGSERTTDNKTVTAREWIDKVLVPLGYGKKLIIEIPFTFPKLPSLLPRQTVMNDFQNVLTRAIEELDSAYHNYLGYRNDDAVVRVRESLDAFRGFVKDNKMMLKTELLENTSTCSHHISEEIFDSLIQIIDSLHNIASKGPHAVTRSGELFDFRPYSEDSETLICGLLCTLVFLAKKLERRMMIS